MGRTLPSPFQIFCSACFFRIEFLAVGFDCFVLTSIGCSMVAGVVM